ncbi:MAG: hypothetical protein PUD22_00710 [Erysipelotrichaceae bacterium]|nr:hypothetical protein [Erysipelotrichaceae bacterium]
MSLPDYSMQKEIVQAIANCYRDEKRKMEEYENGLFHPTDDAFRTMNYITGKIEIVLKYLEEDHRLIIYNEVVLGKKGNWYLDYMSQPTYYRLRKKAYEAFLHCLDNQ